MPVTAYMPMGAEGLVSDPLLVPPVAAQPVRKKRRVVKRSGKTAEASAPKKSARKAAKKSVAARFEDIGEEDYEEIRKESDREEGGARVGEEAKQEGRHAQAVISTPPSSRRTPGPIPRNLSVRAECERPIAKLSPAGMGPGVRRDDAGVNG